MMIGIQNDSATPSAAACAIADDANTMRRRTTCTPMKPSSAPASPPVMIASLKIGRFANSSCQLVLSVIVSPPASPRRGPARGRRGAANAALARISARGRRQRDVVVAVEQQRAVGALEPVLDQVGHHDHGGVVMRAQARRSAP